MKKLNTKQVRKSQTQTKFGGQEIRTQDTEELAEKINEIIEWIDIMELPKSN